MRTKILLCRDRAPTKVVASPIFLDRVSPVSVVYPTNGRAHRNLNLWVPVSTLVERLFHETAQTTSSHCPKEKWEIYIRSHKTNPIHNDSHRGEDRTHVDQKETAIFQTQCRFCIDSLHSNLHHRPIIRDIHRVYCPLHRGNIGNRPRNVRIVDTVNVNQVLFEECSIVIMKKRRGNRVGCGDKSFLPPLQLRHIRSNSHLCLHSRLLLFHLFLLP